MEREAVLAAISALYHDLAVPVRARLNARAFTILCEQGLEAEAVEHGQSFPLSRLWYVRAQLLRHAGDLDGACALYARIEQLTTQMGIAEPCAVPWARPS